MGQNYKGNRAKTKIAVPTLDNRHIVSTMLARTLIPVAGFGSDTSESTELQFIGFEGKQHSVHRVVWQLFTGAKPPINKCVCHHCDNPLCINPDHLFLGSRSDNMQDCIKKGRWKARRGTNVSPHDLAVLVLMLVPVLVVGLACSLHSGGPHA